MSSDLDTQNVGYSFNRIIFGNKRNKLLIHGAKPINLTDITRLHKEHTLYYIIHMKCTVKAIYGKSTIKMSGTQKVDGLDCGTTASTHNFSLGGVIKMI